MALLKPRSFLGKFSSMRKRNRNSQVGHNQKLKVSVESVNELIEKRYADLVDQVKKNGNFQRKATDIDA